MGRGIALEIKRRWPKVYSEYVRYIGVHLYDETQEERMALLGHAQPVRFPDRCIYNLFTQLDYGVGRRQVSYDAIDKAFTIMLGDLGDLKHVRIAIPKIGSNLGGGDWEVIAKIIERQLIKYPTMQITVYDWKGDQPNVERH